MRVLVRDLHGIRRTKRPDLFPMLILAVTLQMAPIKRSDQMTNLLIERYGVTTRFDGRRISCWPVPETMARASVKELEERCKPGYRASALKDIAIALCKRFPTLREPESMPAEEANQANGIEGNR